MALIGTLRNKLGAWVVVFVFVAIAAFTLSDMLGKNSVLLGGNNVGKIAGSTITLKEFQNAIQERETNYRLTFNRAPSERETPLLQEQAWELLVAKYAIESQYEKLGVKVTGEEVWDMIQGKNVDENLRSTPIFLDERGQFDRNKVVQYLQYINQQPLGSEDRFRWESFQQSLAPARTRLKYENLLVKTSYVTSAEAEREYHVQNDVAEVKYLYVPFFAISDSSVNVSNSDLQDYYNKHKERYKTDHTADLSYVTFPVVPSAADSADIRKELKTLAEEFKTTPNDSLFATSNSDNPNAFARYTPTTLPPFINPDSLIQGKVFGPFVDGNTFKIVKISSAGKDTIYTARARHILVKWTSDSIVTKSVARQKANNILKELKAGADFATKAREASEDPGSASRGGDLGWFSTGQMVKPFQDAVFNATKTGLLNHIVESEFGFHIIDVTNLKDNTAYKIGVIESEITPSDASINDALRKAETFQSGLSGIEEFKKKADEDGLNVLDANNIGTGDRRIGILGDARQIVQWLFRDASIGEVSQVFDLRDQFVVAVMTGEIEKGYKSLEMVKEEITPLVKNERKGKVIIEKLSGLQGSLDEIASSFGKDASVYTNNELKLSSSSLPGIGFDPVALGTAFSLENGQRSKPFAGENGVTIFEMSNKTIAPAIADYGLYKTQLQQTISNRTTYNIADAIKESSNIEDERYKFY
ncbi:MAG TPA: SurA N-terminal domain-containing protein [Cyclobacteriaceae bacterium]|nr:SurA N-terminal domain-containing protein [Cyclobacteriaceae bacterium]